MLEQKRSVPDDGDGERAALDLLASGKLEIEGRLVDASNATLYCTITTSGQIPKSPEIPKSPRIPRSPKTPRSAKIPKSQQTATAAGNSRGQVACVYKPIAGERPLWDFPMGTLAGREVAAYVVSRAAGWEWSAHGHAGRAFRAGMCQLWIDPIPMWT